MTRLLQNHPGYSRYPVQGFSWALFKELSFRRRLVGITLIAIGLLFVYTVLGPLMICAGYWFIYWGASRKKREQKKYYKLANISAPTKKQLEALQLGSFNIFDCNQWTDTLETWPCEVRVPGKLNAFKSLPVIKTRNLVGQLEESWSIISTKDYKDTYSALLKGLHTERFVKDYYSQDNPKDMAQRICGLVQIEETVFEQLLTFDRGPRKLIWAWDLWRAIGISRWSFECGFIDEETAWENILQASSYAHTIYDDLDEFLIGMRVGHAYWCNDFKDALERRDSVDRYLNPVWEHGVHKAGWSKANTQLNDEMLTGFKQVEESILSDKYASGLVDKANEMLQ